MNIQHLSGLVLPLRNPQNKYYEGQLITSQKTVMNVLIIPLYKQKYWPKFTKFVCGKDGKQNLVFSSAPSTPSYCMPVLTCKMRCPSLFAGLL